MAAAANLQSAGSRRLHIAVARHSPALPIGMAARHLVVGVRTDRYAQNMGARQAVPRRGLLSTPAPVEKLLLTERREVIVASTPRGVSPFGPRQGPSRGFSEDSRFELYPEMNDSDASKLCGVGRRSRMCSTQAEFFSTNSFYHRCDTFCMVRTQPSAQL